jgi:HEAT repeat protein
MKNLMKLSLALILTLFLINSVVAQQPDDESYDKYLLKCLKDENMGIRASAAQLLGERKVQAAVKPLIKMLKTDKAYNARIVAAVALYKIGDERAIPELKKLAFCDHCKTVRHVAAAIAQEMKNIQLAKKEAQQIVSR